jgi:hypothetical protein
MTKIVYFLISCSNCEIEKLYFNFNSVKYKNCMEQADVIREKISSYYVPTNAKNQGWYTKDGKLVIGYKCE